MTSRTSLDHLEHDVERNRAVLVESIDALRATLLGDVRAMRRKASFGYVGAELRDRARAHPLRTFAIGAGLTFPLWRLGRRIPVPLLLIGTGIALARPTTRGALAGAARGASDRVTQVGDRASDRLSGAWTGTKAAGAGIGQTSAAGLDSAQAAVRGAAGATAARASELADAGRETVSDLAEKGSALLQGGSDRLAGARDHAGRTIAQTRSRAVDLFHDRPMLVAGTGLALGALLAAIVPATETEGRLLDKVAPDLKRKASDLVDEGYEKVSTVAGDVYDGAVGRARQQGLSPEGAENAASDLGEKLGAVVDAALGQHGAGRSKDGNAIS